MESGLGVLRFFHRGLPSEQPSRPHQDRQSRGAEQHDRGDVFADVVGADGVDDPQDHAREERSGDAPEPADDGDDQRERREVEPAVTVSGAVIDRVTATSLARPPLSAKIRSARATG